MKKTNRFIVLTILCTLILSSCSQRIENEPITETSKSQYNNQSISNENNDEISNKDETINQTEKEEFIENTEEETSISDLNKINEDIKVLTPKIGYTPDLSKESEEKWNKGVEISKKIENGELDFDSLTQEQEDLLNSFDESCEGIWDVLGGGCSWYCGGGPYKITSSSNLKESSQITYEADNAHDFDLRTAWIEGAKGYGIGEYIEYYFTPFSPRVTQIKIFNGYTKSEELWKDNARIKRINLYINDKPYAILEFEDTRALQTFEIKPVQSEIEGKDLILKFEIIEVYLGEKYEDSVITEINFDGLDVH